MRLALENGTCGYNRKTVLKDVSVRIEQGEIAGILGPNGIGKTTVFRSMLGLLKLIRGERLLDGRPVDRISARDFARAVAYVPQCQGNMFPFTVRDVVVMGRAPYLKTFQSPEKKDYDIAESVMEDLGISHLLNQQFTRISGGEKQMVLIARALAQEPGILMLDEPTANLDFGNQIKVLSCIRRLADRGLGVLMTTHNPDHTFLCCDRVILLTRRHTILDGPVDEVVTEKNLLDAYGVNVRIIRRQENGSIITGCVPSLDLTESGGKTYPTIH